MKLCYFTRNSGPSCTKWQFLAAHIITYFRYLLVESNKHPRNILAPYSRHTTSVSVRATSTVTGRTAPFNKVPVPTFSSAIAQMNRSNRPPIHINHACAQHSLKSWAKFKELQRGKKRDGDIKIFYSRSTNTTCSISYIQTYL